MKVAVLAFLAPMSVLCQPLTQEELCRFATPRPGPIAAARESAPQVLLDLQNNEGLASSSNLFGLWPVTGSRVAQNAFAANCPEIGLEGIFYDPNYFATLTTPGSSRDWFKYFVFAHELGHIQNHHLSGLNSAKPGPVKELEADESAGFALAMMRAPIAAILAAVDKINPADIDIGDHPARCKRRASAIQGYNRAARILETPEFAACGQCVRAGAGAGMYVRAREIANGGAILAAAVQKCGSGPAPGDRPLNFETDLAGFCAYGSLPADTVLTWENVGFCH